MNKYKVAIQLAGTITYNIVAEDSEAAIKKAFKELDIDDYIVSIGVKEFTNE